MSEELKLQQIDQYRWRIPKQGKMNTDGIIYAERKMLHDINKEHTYQQVANVACLPGIVGQSLAMPDIHWGYGFPIGGVAAFDSDEGIVSPGGVGYDINCGVRLIRSNLDRYHIKERIKDLIEQIFRNVPSGVGARRKDLKLNQKDEKAILQEGVQWAISKGYGVPRDMECMEDGGCIPGADPDLLSQRALERGQAQLGTLGSGNHFIEIGYVSEIYDERIAAALGLRRDGITIIIHSGSRGLGHQVCDDFIKVMRKSSEKYKIDLPDQQLCCAPLHSREGKNYLAAMACAANFAFTNRQLMMHWVRESFSHVMGEKDLGLDLIYDVCHNIAKFENVIIAGKNRKVCVHRKGATRAFPPHHPETGKIYKEIGQPVLIPGDMGRYSYVLVGTEQALKETFGSTCHGAGRVMSRRQSKKFGKDHKAERELLDKGILIRAASRRTILEELPEAYKDVADVVNVVEGAGLSKKVVKLTPCAVVKG
ncbi:MAG: RtcB family protein [bacterium]